MLEIIALKAFKDNYIWTLRDERRAAVVDPGDAGPVIEYLDAERLTPAAILLTHHHPDHVGGVPELLRRAPAPVYGPRNEPIATLSHPVAEGERLSIAEPGVDLAVLDIPGYTRAHITHYGAISGAASLFR